MWLDNGRSLFCSWINVSSIKQIHKSRRTASIILPFPGWAWTSLPSQVQPERVRPWHLVETGFLLNWSRTSKHGNSILSFPSRENWADEEMNLAKSMEESGTVPEDLMRRCRWYWRHESSNRRWLMGAPITISARAIGTDRFRMRRKFG